MKTVIKLTKVDTKQWKLL